MRNFSQIAIVLTVAAAVHVPAPIAAQSGISPAPVPGPYQIIVRQQPVAPTFKPQPYVQPMPYWMQSQPRPRAQASGAQAAQTQAPAVARAPQQPFISGWNWSPQAPNAQGNTPNPQGYGAAAPTPGYFPGYAANQQSRPAQPAPNYGSTYPAPNYGGQPWPQQGFIPMAAPWGNGWGNNWNNNGNGYPQGYAAPWQPQR